MPSSGIIFTSFIRVFFCFPTQKQMKTPAFPEPSNPVKGQQKKHFRYFSHVKKIDVCLINSLSCENKHKLSMKIQLVSK